ncbi:hypothetical protein BC567DRAFT_43524 [Phyllosticta citribraziliensis]
MDRVNTSVATRDDSRLATNQAATACRHGYRLSLLANMNSAMHIQHKAILSPTPNVTRPSVPTQRMHRLHAPNTPCPRARAVPSPSLVCYRHTHRSTLPQVHAPR